MAIEVKHIEGQNAPLIICDVCDKPITGGDGIVLYELKPDSDSRRLLFAHKSRDCNQVAQSLQDLQGWDDLDAWLYFLMHNTGVEITPELIERANEL